MSADAYDALTPAQQAALSEAAEAAVGAATAASKAEEEEDALHWICPSPMEIIQMPDAELDAIRTLKNSIGATPDTFTCE